MSKFSYSGVDSQHSETNSLTEVVFKQQILLILQLHDDPLSFSNVEFAFSLLQQLLTLRR